MTDLPNGFTGFSHRDPNFVSAGDALRGSRYDDTPFAARKQAQARNLAEAWSPAGAERVGAGAPPPPPRPSTTFDNAFAFLEKFECPWI